MTVAGESVDYRLRVSTHDLAVALGIETDLVTPLPRAAFEARAAALSDYLTRRLLVRGDGAPCPAGAPRLDFDPLPDEIRVDLTFRCPAAIRELSIRYLLFFDIDAAHRGLGRLMLPTGEEEFLFDRTLTHLELSVEQPGPQLSPARRFLRVLWLGAEHILVGADHLLFLMALVIVSDRLWTLLKVVTAFTLAHSLTLALAWFGLLDLPARLVESLIALSIIYVAVENLLGRGMENRWMLAGGFGLVHGLGFYRVLSDLGLDAGGIVANLLAFNLGVEVGQVAFVAALYPPLLWWLRRPWYRRSMKLASAAILVVAGWWLVERAMLM